MFLETTFQIFCSDSEDGGSSESEQINSDNVDVFYVPIECPLSKLEVNHVSREFFAVRYFPVNKRNNSTSF